MLSYSINVLENYIRLYQKTFSYFLPGIFLVAIFLPSFIFWPRSIWVWLIFLKLFLKKSAHSQTPIWRVKSISQKLNRRLRIPYGHPKVCLRETKISWDYFRVRLSVDYLWFCHINCDVGALFDLITRVEWCMLLSLGNAMFRRNTADILIGWFIF